MSYTYLCYQHGKKKYLCKECEGSSLCSHSIQKYFCKVCSPWRCEDCDQTYSRGVRGNHLKTQKHQGNVPKIVENVEII